MGNYTEVTPSRIRSFLDDRPDQPELIHIICTGHKGMYLVVVEDALEQYTGYSEYLSGAEISNKYSIII